MSLTTRTDITAVKLHKDLVLAGVGSFVNIFDRYTTKLLLRLQVLEGQKVYGFVISKCGQKILVFGGKQFTVLYLDDLKESPSFSRLFDPIKCDDWLHSVVWASGNTVTVLTAHNVIQKWDIDTQTLAKQHLRKDNSILYSGLLQPVGEDLVVLAGTVFSEVIIYWCGSDQPLHILKGHRGVIFCISCNPEKGLIVTTSDDRSVRIWHMKNPENYPCDSFLFWENISIECTHEVYGHTARVMRCIIVNDLVISGGEDAGICYWRDGCLVRKIVAHQTAPIWSMDSDGEFLITGGGDAGIKLHPLTVTSDYSDIEMLKFESNPKVVLFTARKNIVILSDVKSDLIYYDVAAKFKMVYRLQHKSTYKMMAISSCKQLIAVVDMEGVLNVFVEICKGPACIQNIIDTNLDVGKIRSMHWAGNRHLVFCAEDGNITVLAARANETEVFANFVLPQCKERWLTSCAIDPTNNSFIAVSDRCSSIHFFLKGQKDPVKSFRKVHRNYGSTSLKIRNNVLVSTGRDGTIKYYSINKQDYKESKYLNSKELDFQWVEQFLDKNEKLICGFHSKTFIVYDIETSTKIIEIICGGGHRSYDAVRYLETDEDKTEEFVRLTYVKNSVVFLVTFQLSKIVPKSIVCGSHSREINCMKVFKTDTDNSVTYYISGGEDTTLRISSVNQDLEFKDELVFKHLSNVRALKTFIMNDDKLCVISAGGRAQICINVFEFDKAGDKINISTQEVVNFLLKGSDNERKRNRTWRLQDIDFDPETRIMDVDAIRFDNNTFLVFAGCSDALLRTFIFSVYAKDVQFRPLKEYKNHEICILKTACIKFFDKDIVVTCTTRGHVTFWDVVNEEIFEVNPIFTFIAHNAGINSFDYKIIGQDDILIATGADDNRISMNIVKITTNSRNGSMEIQRVADWKSDSFHCSQITGIILLNDILVSTSIDQRITLNKWEVIEDSIKCRYVKQVYSDIADIQGMEVLDHTEDSVTVCVFGKGLEVLKINIPSST